jgi:hypothetical protein
MFHYRWAREVDQQAVARRLAVLMAPPGADEAALEGVAKMVIARMVDRVWFVGSNEQTAPQIEQSYRGAMAQLDAHLATRAYLFGARPAFGDFGLWGQVYNAWTDPTAGGILRESAPSLVAWVERMLEPKAEGDFEDLDALWPTLEPFVRSQVGGLFLPWSDANANAIAAGQPEFTVTLPSGTWTQKPQKYHAKSLAALRARYAAVPDKSRLDARLEASGCLTWLQG